MAALDYGCHCAAILSGQLAGLGQPVDALDSVCKDYLGCMRCVKKQTQCQKIDVSSYGKINSMAHLPLVAGNILTCNRYFYEW